MISFVTISFDAFDLWSSQLIITLQRGSHKQPINPSCCYFSAVFHSATKIFLVEVSERVKTLGSSKVQDFERVTMTMGCMMTRIFSAVLR